ncbi:MAG TPA: co-chaperone YbbN [Spongiibacteraceae bacterium]|jgi:putative thioredoxin|nr:co-chaperone YbbN [Spongiibacteraceae bacterium]HUH37925.1 co-chaperone YbbN [Spongiibacteraceae bacterium]
MNEANAAQVIVDIDETNAKQYLIDESFKRPVLVDFWADWCAPCRTLMPLLEKLAQEYAGAFLLARVNADRLQPIASQFGVRSLPTVILMKDGQPLDGFTGAQPENAIRQFLEPHLPKPWDALLDQAAQLMEAGQYGEALSPLKLALEDSRQRPDIACALAQCYIELNRLPEAEAILDGVRMADQDAYYQQLRAQLDLARNAARAPEITALEEQLAADPDNIDAAFQLALQYQQHNHQREALEVLISLLQKDREARGGEVRKTLLDMLAALGKGDPLAVEYQKKLYRLLY